MNGKTDGLKDRTMDGYIEIDRWINRLMDKQTDRETDGQTDR